MVNILPQGHYGDVDGNRKVDDVSFEHPSDHRNDAPQRLLRGVPRDRSSLQLVSEAVLQPSPELLADTVSEQCDVVKAIGPWIVYSRGEAIINGLPASDKYSLAA